MRLFSICWAGWERFFKKDESTRTAALMELQGRRVPVYRFINSGDERLWNMHSYPGKVVLASYPRSGNTLLRRLLEEATGIITGSDTRPNRTLSRSLIAGGMQGEGVVDERVIVVKTHFPERSGYRPYEASRVVLLVRNPFDAIDSYFNMAMTNTHEKSLHPQNYERFSEVWEGMLANETRVWQRFHSYWLDKAQGEGSLPMLLVRYEDILADKKVVMEQVLAFLQGIPVGEIASSVSWPRLCQLGASAAPSASASAPSVAPYKPRVGKFGTGLLRCSSKQLDHCVQIAGEVLTTFGYHVDPVSHTLNVVAPSPWLLSPVRGKQGQERPSVMVVNEGRDIRDKADWYGRGMTQFRRSQTQQDRQPLETL
ncbi:unnamed protein product [Chrysoparadoxa australica]